MQGEEKPSFRKFIIEQVTISLSPIGHTRLTHSFILKQEQQPQCIECQIPYIVKRFLIEYRDLALIRQCFFNANNMKD